MIRLLAASVILAWSVSLPAAATYYHFTDKDGQIHITDTPPSKKFEAFPIRRGKTRVIPASERYNTIIERAAKRYRISPALIKAVIRVESNFKPDAISHAGAQGLMQLMPETGKQFGIDNPFDPEQSIMGGARYLRYLINVFNGNLRRALAGYNAGENAVFRFERKRKELPPYKETRNFIRKVVKYYETYRGRRLTDAERFALSFPKSDDLRADSGTTISR
jgi:soluble lytic murein transglycosylase